MGHGAMKKHFAIFLLSILAACSGAANVDTETATSLPSQVAPVTVSTEEETTPAVLPQQFDEVAENFQNTEIEFWYVWNRSGVDPFQEIISEFNRSNDYDITVTALDQKDFGDLFGEMNTAIESGELPEVVLGYNYQYLAWEAAGDAVVDLTPYTYDATFGLSEETIAGFYPVFWEHDLIGEQRLGFPAQPSGQVIFYNQTWAQELGFYTPPSTPEQFKQQACVAAEANGDGTGGWFINTSGASVAGWVYAFGAEIETPEGGYDFNTSETSAAFEFLHDLKATGCAWEPGTRYPNGEFVARKGLFHTSSILSIPFIRDAFEIEGNNDGWIPIPFPGLGGPSITVYGPSYVMVRSSPEAQLAAWLLIKYLLEPENQAVLVKAGGSFPVSRSAVTLLEEAAWESPQWFAAVEMLNLARFEPRYQSWSTVRAALQDAAGMIFKGNFDLATLFELLEQLQATAEELHAEGGGN